MGRQKKKQNGITLIALVISIIVMLILAGISLNMTIGENGIVTKAQEASRQHKIATELENLNLELTKLNIDTISNDDVTAIQEIVNELIRKGVIDGAVTTSEGQIAVGIDRVTGSRYFFGAKGDNIYKIVRGKDDLLVAELSQNASGGDITGGTALVTADSFNNDSSLSEEEKGKFTITADSEVAFMDTISGELSIYVKSGVHATVGIYADMTLTNTGIRRSAIDIEEGGVLDIYIGEGVDVVVNSGLATEASYGEPGKGGYAGIHVPWTDTNGNGVLDEGDSYATLNIHGSTTENLADAEFPKIYSYGGNASKGETPTKSDYVSGGGGAGAGIGGNGGDGGLGKSGTSETGKKAGDAGYITINDKVKVYSYGGAGSSGTIGVGANSGAGGGYPAAGIGGGGAGAGGSSCCSGSGGYSAGGADKTTQKYSDMEITNGGVATVTSRHTDYAYWGTLANGYYFGGLQEYDASVQGSYTSNRCLPENFNKELVGLGGLGGCGRDIVHLAGNGGIAGMGGKVEVSADAKVYAFNGNRYTDGLSGHEYNDGENEAPIYAQMGKIPEKYRWISYNSGVSLEIVSEEENIEKSGYINSLMTGKKVTINNNVPYLINIDLSTQGIGSGAGYTEVYNGTYDIK